MNQTNKRTIFNLNGYHLDFTKDTDKSTGRNSSLPLTVVHVHSNLLWGIILVGLHKNIVMPLFPSL
jgi:hypothetical protein